MWTRQRDTQKKRTPMLRKANKWNFKKKSKVEEEEEVKTQKSMKLVGQET